MFLHVPLNNKSSFKGRQNSSDQAGSMNHEQVSHITSSSVFAGHALADRNQGEF